LTVCRRRWQSYREARVAVVGARNRVAPKVRPPVDRAVVTLPAVFSVPWPMFVPRRRSSPCRWDCRPRRVDRHRAVKVTGWPDTDGLAEELTRCSYWLLTVWLGAVPLLDRSCYRLVAGRHGVRAHGRPDVLMMARAAPPMMLTEPGDIRRPSKKNTVRWECPDVGVTVAVNVTAWPKVDGLTEEARVVVLLVLRRRPSRREERTVLRQRRCRRCMWP